MTVEITKEWLQKISLEDDLLDPAAGAFRFEPWSVAEAEPDFAPLKVDPSPLAGDRNNGNSKAAVQGASHQEVHTTHT